MLNRLATAQATNSSWGQSYSYDGFGNLTDQNVIAGSAPTYHVVPDPATNHLGGEDANGNASGYTYDVENRVALVPPVYGTYNGYQETTNSAYSYAPGNRRVWRGTYVVTYDTTTGFWDTTPTTDEVTFWGVNGQKLGTYPLSVTRGGNPSNPPIHLRLTIAIATEYYFGGKLIAKNGVAVVADRLGSIGQYYPYGQEKPSATQNGTEKFTGYFRDSETGLDYAVNRYHNPGTGRFLTADAVNPRLNDPGSLNLYAYVGGDPVNRVDPQGKDWCDVFSIVDTGDDDCDPMDAGAYDNVIIAEIAATLPNIGPNVCASMGKEFNAATDSCADSDDDSQQPSCEDQLDSSIFDFLAAKNSPLTSYSGDLVTDAQLAGLNPWLLVAISDGESTYGTASAAQKTANAFGLLHRVGKQYILYNYNGDWNAGIVAAAKTVDSQFVNGNVTVQEMFSGKPGAYCQGNCTNDVNDISSVFSANWGDPNNPYNLLWPCPPEN